MNVDTATGAKGARRIAPVYLFKGSEILMNSSVKNTWRHVMNYPSWQSYSEVQHISGPRGKEGEVVRLIKEESGFTFPPYFARTIRLEPESRVTWKTYPDKGNSNEGMDLFGIIDFKLFDVGGRTRYCWESMYEFLVPYENEAEVEAFRKEQNANFDTLFASILPKLQKLVEEDA